MKHKPMRMKDYVNQLDKILKSIDAKVLMNSGKISNKVAIEKVKSEYKRYQVKEFTSIEKEYFNSITKISDIARKIDKS